MMVATSAGAVEEVLRGGSRGVSTQHPSVSILTFVRNAVDTLPSTIESVLQQTALERLDYIVVDGASNDGTIDILRSYDAHIDQWVSEKDRGIVDAQNKAILLSGARYVFFLNADDWIEPKFIEAAVDAIAVSGADIVYGDIQVRSSDGAPLHRLNGDPAFFGRMGAFYQMPCVNFPTMVIRRALFDEIGLFDERFRVAPDYEWLLRLVKNRKDLKVRYVPDLVVNFRLGGNSDLLYYIGLKDAYRASIMHGGKVALAMCFYGKRMVMHWCKGIASTVIPRPLFSRLLGIARRFA
ncbi:glycosyltransferase family 2 protein [Trinickia acidisoli]|uniref:glycosyltransferase family 2 protein n=1 Tax=Trinickia acidisoli TaxID=2767482 RepID=UPI001A8CA1EC|nr:glycosyltransferase family 2 protein [Trinickia acidisoli]